MSVNFTAASGASATPVTGSVSISGVSQVTGSVGVTNYPASLIKASYIRIPVIAQDVANTGVGVFALTGSTNSTAFSIPTGWKDKYCTFFVSGSQRVQFGITTGSVPPVLSFNAASSPVTVGSFSRGATILPEIKVDGIIPSSINGSPTTFLCYVFEPLLNLTGSVEVYVSEGTNS